MRVSGHDEHHADHSDQQDHYNGQHKRHPYKTVGVRQVSFIQLHMLPLVHTSCFAATYRIGQWYRMTVVILLAGKLSQFDARIRPSGGIV